MTVFIFFLFEAGPLGTCQKVILILRKMYLHAEGFFSYSFSIDAFPTTSPSICLIFCGLGKYSII